jgi:hypothetical protein
VRVYTRNPDRYSERFSIPMSEKDMLRLELAAERAGQTKTDFARRTLLAALNGCAPPMAPEGA